MKIRSYSPEDFDRISEIYQKYWKGKLEVPDQAGRLMEAVVEDEDGKIVTYGMMKLWAEVMMIMDSSIPKRNKVEALRILMLTAEMTASKQNLEAFHVFTNNESYAAVLQNHFQCERMNLIVLRRRMR